MADIGPGGKLILAFVTLLIGIVLVGQVASEGQNVTRQTQITSESEDISSARLTTGINNSLSLINTSKSFSVTNNPTSWKTEDSACNINSFVMRNSSGSVISSGNYSLNAQYGNFTLTNTSLWVFGTGGQGTNTTFNNTLLAYLYCDDDFLNISWGRNILNLIGGFFAIALLIISVGLFYDVAKDAGILNV